MLANYVYRWNDVVPTAEWATSSVAAIRALVASEDDKKPPSCICDVDERAVAYNAVVLAIRNNVASSRIVAALSCFRLPHSVRSEEAVRKWSSFGSRAWHENPSTWSLLRLMSKTPAGSTAAMSDMVCALAQQDDFDPHCAVNNQTLMHLMSVRALTLCILEGLRRAGYRWCAPPASTALQLREQLGVAAVVPLVCLTLSDYVDDVTDVLRCAQAAVDSGGELWWSDSDAISIYTIGRPNGRRAALVHREHYDRSHLYMLFIVDTWIMRQMGLERSEDTSYVLDITRATSVWDIYDIVRVNMHSARASGVDVAVMQASLDGFEDAVCRRITDRLGWLKAVVASCMP